MCSGDPVCDSAVMWSGAEREAEPGLAIADVTQYDAKKMQEGGVSEPKVHFMLTLVLYRSFSHMFLLSVSNSLLASHYQSPMLPPPHSLILSCPVLLLSFFFSPSLPSELWVCHAVQSSGHGCDFQQASNYVIDKNTDLVAAAAGWWEGGRDMKI